MGRTRLMPQSHRGASSNPNLATRLANLSAKSVGLHGLILTDHELQHCRVLHLHAKLNLLHAIDSSQRIKCRLGHFASIGIRIAWVGSSLEWENSNLCSWHLDLLLEACYKVVVRILAREGSVLRVAY